MFHFEGGGKKKKKRKICALCSDPGWGWEQERGGKRVGRSVAF